MSGGFEDLGLLPELVRATQEMGWVLPSDVQDEAIPLILGGGDVMVAAETGAGKTGAFALPAIQIVHETRRGIASGSTATATAGAGTPAKRARIEEPLRLNVNDRSPVLAVAEDGLTCQCRQPTNWGGVRATRGISHGKVYYEAMINDDGLCRFGWSTQAGSLDLGTDKNGFGFGGTGKKSNDRKFDSYGAEFSKGDVIGCYLEIGPSGVDITFAKNGTSFGTAFKLPKSPGSLFPAICMKNAECRVNFGEKPFAFAPTGDFVGIANAPTDAFVSGPNPHNSTATATTAGDAVVGPVCIILAPARDLAEQTFKGIEDMKKYVASPSITQALLIGGVDSRETSRQLTRTPDIITATPGKLLDMVEANKILLHQVRLLILDEADRFTDEENSKMVTKLYQKLRLSTDVGAAPGRLQVCFFSATLHSPEIGKLAEQLCKNPTWVDLKGKDSVPDTVHHVVIPVDPGVDRSFMSREDGAVAAVTDGVHSSDSVRANVARPLSAEEASEGIKRLKQRMLVSLIDSLHMDQCLIFCRTNLDCDNLEKYLTAVGGGAKFRSGMEKGKENAYSCVVLAGMRSMDDRRRNLAAFKAGDVRFLICTDVAARGLDIKELPYVINMTLPDDIENYIHRIGRVGRADRMGLAISLVATTQEKVWYHQCKNRGQGCRDTRLKTSGGCCIWYDEPSLLAAITKRLGMEKIPLMHSASNSKTAAGISVPYLFSLPEGMADGVVYGEERGEVHATSEHVEAIRDQVSSLAALEVQAQSAFLALKLRYAAKAK